MPELSDLFVCVRYDLSSGASRQDDKVIFSKTLSDGSILQGELFGVMDLIDNSEIESVDDSLALIFVNP